MNRNVALALVVIVLVGAVAFFVYSIRPKKDEAAAAGKWEDRAYHHVQEQDMGPGDIFWYAVPYQDYHRLRVAVEASGAGVTLGIMEPGVEDSLKSDSGWFLDHTDRAQCLHQSVTNATFDCEIQPPVLLIVGDARLGTTTDDRERIHVKVDAYDCTAGCPPLPQQ